MTLQTVGSIGFGPHPTWVSYLTQDPSGQWVHTTLWDLPAHTRVNVTIDQYDSGSPLRNQQWGQVTGTIGDDATLNGKTFQVINSNTGNGVGPHLRHSHPGDQRAARTATTRSANLCAVQPRARPSRRTTS